MESYAVIQTGGKQYRVTCGQVIEVERLNAEAGQEVAIAEVVALNDGSTLKVGTPFVEGAQGALAVFGQKDFQQAAIIKRMVRDLNFPVEILVAPIVREGDGLAKSSRNVYLNQQERQNALGLSRALALAQAMVDSGEREVPILRNALSRLLKEHHLQPDYIEFVDEDSLQPKQTIDAQTHVVLAAFCGKTRLIDNAALTVH